MAGREIISFVMDSRGDSAGLVAVFTDGEDEVRESVIGWVTVRRKMRIGGVATAYDSIEPLIPGEDGCPEPAGDCDNFNRVERR